MLEFQLLKGNILNLDETADIEQNMAQLTSKRLFWKNFQERLS